MATEDSERPTPITLTSATRIRLEFDPNGPIYDQLAEDGIKQGEFRDKVYTEVREYATLADEVIKRNENGQYDIRKAISIRGKELRVSLEVVLLEGDIAVVTMLRYEPHRGISI